MRKQNRAIDKGKEREVDKEKKKKRAFGTLI
jgi:hypothetical protein